MTIFHIEFTFNLNFYIDFAFTSVYPCHYFKMTDSDCRIITREEAQASLQHIIILRWTYTMCTTSCVGKGFPNFTNLRRDPMIKVYAHYGDYGHDWLTFRNHYEAWLERNTEDIERRLLKRECYITRRNYTWAYIQVLLKFYDLGMHSLGKAVAHLVGEYVGLPDIQRA